MDASSPVRIVFDCRTELMTTPHYFLIIFARQPPMVCFDRGHLMSDRDIAVIGYYETKIELRSGRHVYDFAGEAMAGAIAHAGIDTSEIDGFAVSSCFSDAGNPFYAPVLASYL